MKVLSRFKLIAGFQSRAKSIVRVVQIIEARCEGTNIENAEREHYIFEGKTKAESRDVSAVFPACIPRTVACALCRLFRSHCIRCDSSARIEVMRHILP
jgi:hypothetical protein